MFKHTQPYEVRSFETIVSGSSWSAVALGVSHTHTHTYVGRSCMSNDMLRQRKHRENDLTDHLQLRGHVKHLCLTQVYTWMCKGTYGFVSAWVVFLQTCLSFSTTLISSNDQNVNHNLNTRCLITCAYCMGTLRFHTCSCIIVKNKIKHITSSFFVCAVLEHMEILLVFVLYNSEKVSAFLCYLHIYHTYMFVVPYSPLTVDSSLCSSC